MPKGKYQAPRTGWGIGGAQRKLKHGPTHKALRKTLGKAKFPDPPKKPRKKVKRKPRRRPKK